MKVHQKFFSKGFHNHVKKTILSLKVNIFPQKLQCLINGVTGNNHTNNSDAATMACLSRFYVEQKILKSLQLTTIIF